MGEALRVDFPCQIGVIETEIGREEANRIPGSLEDRALPQHGQHPCLFRIADGSIDADLALRLQGFDEIVQFVQFPVGGRLFPPAIEPELADLPVIRHQLGQLHLHVGDVSLGKIRLVGFLFPVPK